jgi:23S rRNA (uracil1939-C5)-methyltransferase
LGKKIKQQPVYEKIKIVDIGSEGKAVARHEGMVIFTTLAVPGDVVDLQVTRKKNKYAEGKVVRIHEESPDRVPAFCEHFEVCGGCTLQYLPYEKQLYYKEKQVYNQLTRIGHIELPEINPIIGSANPTFYRNKLEFTFSHRRWLTEEEIKSGEQFDQLPVLGFHVQGLYDKVLDIHKCWLQPDPSNEIRNSVKEYALAHQLPFFNLKTKEGFLRNILIRNTLSGELMVIMVFFQENREEREKLLDFIDQKFPGITSLLFVINGKGNDTITDQEIHIYKGRDYIVEEMEGLKFRIGPKSFFQTNSLQAYELYKVAREFAGLTGKEIVYDLYTGTGTIANFIAHSAKKVIGIEYVPEAIEDAVINSELNGITNTRFFAGDMKDILTENFIHENGHPDVIITDPPRAGMSEEVVKTILAASPEKVVYVSCNPATQARDLSLMDAVYRVTKVQPVDMFPQTHHVENVVLLEKKI